MSKVKPGVPKSTVFRKT